MADSLVYITCDDNNLYALNAGSSTIVYCGGGGTHYFYAFDANTGVQKWQFAVGNSGLQASKPFIYGGTRQ